MNWMKCGTAASLLSAATLFTACTPTADLVLQNGKVVTVDQAKPELPEDF